MSTEPLITIEPVIAVGAALRCGRKKIACNGYSHNHRGQFSGQEYDVTAYWESKESLAFAERINQSLQLANWKIVDTDKWRGLMGGVVGGFVNLHPDADARTKDAASALVTSLQKEAVEAKLTWQNPKNNPKHNKISLTVGSKR